jgi:hypothetical protein
MNSQDENSQVALFRNSIVEKYLKQCVMDEWQNLEFPVNAGWGVCHDFYDTLAELFCSGNEIFDINNYIESEGIDISRMFGNDEEDDFDVMWELKANRVCLPYNTTSDFTKPQLLRAYAKACVYKILNPYVDEDENKVLVKLAELFGFTHKEERNGRWSITFEEHEEHEECQDC